MFVKDSRLVQFYTHLTVSLGVVNSSWCGIEIHGVKCGRNFSEYLMYFVT